MKLGFGLGVTFLSPLLLLAQSKDARACGGCFHPPAGQAMATVVTGHRMAFATSGTRTVLWDQIKYAGNPSEFSWVLPVKGTVKIESASDAWFEALEAVTNAQVSPAPLNCFNRTGGDGCSCGAASNDVALSAPQSKGSFGGPSSGVTVTHEGSVGPYNCVQVEGGGQALAKWLPDNGYVVPPDIAPMLDAYAQEGFGFIALKLQPGQQTKQMTPVRVVTDGGANTLPLRMVAAGTGDFVAITLYVIAEGRYEIDGFGQTSVDTSKLTYDWASSTSNYADVRQQALGAQGGKVWLTSFAQLNAFTQTHTDVLGNSLTFTVNKGGMPGGFPGGPTGPTFTNLTDLYFAQAESDVNATDVCSGSQFSSKLTSKGLVYDDCGGGVVSDAGGPQPPMGMCGAPPPVNCTPPASGGVPSSSLVCNGHSDVAAAMIGMHPDTVWVTRLESNLPRESLAADLKIKPAAQQPVTNKLRATTHVNPPCDLLENHPEVTALHRRSQEAGVGIASGIALFFARRLKRRRPRDVS
jgi:Uncharacterized protein conserved in bacteria (DUF2330)